MVGMILANVTNNRLELLESLTLLVQMAIVFITTQEGAALLSRDNPVIKCRTASIYSSDVSGSKTRTLFLDH